MHRNTNEIWPLSAGGSHHKALSYNVKVVHLGARLDRPNEPQQFQNAPKMDYPVFPLRKWSQEDSSLIIWAFDALFSGDAGK